MLVLRTERHLNDDTKRKVALFCNVEESAVIESVDVSTIYEVPIKMLDQKLDQTVLRKLALPVDNEPPLTDWRKFLTKLKNPKHSIRVGLIGKYVELPDAYKSISESFIHSGAMNECAVNVEYIHSEDITEENVTSKLKDWMGYLWHQVLDQEELTVRF